METGVASVTDIDRAMELGYRHPMGPLKLTDLVGLDVRLAILAALFPRALFGQINGWCEENASDAALHF